MKPNNFNSLFKPFFIVTKFYQNLQFKLKQHQIKKYDKLYTFMIPLEEINRLTRELFEFDPATDYHCQRVADMTEEFGTFLNIPKDQLLIYKQAARLHDIGKKDILPEIIKKPSDLDPSEKTIIQQHPIYSSEEIISLIPNSSPDELDYLTNIARIVRHHHENYDGKHGYPDNLKGKEIPFGSRLLKITDTFDALTSRRPYKDAYDIDKSIELMNNTNRTQFDSSLLIQFFSFLTIRQTI